MKTKLYTTITIYVFAALLMVAVAASELSAKEWVIFDDEVHYGALTTHDGGFEVSGENPYEGKKCLARELVAGEWAWITGIGENNPMDLDLTGIDFDNAFLEFYIDSGEVALDYIEMRLAGEGWTPDCQTVIETDGKKGYQQIKVFLKEFIKKDSGNNPKDLDDFTDGSGEVDTWSIGFSPSDDTTVYVDELRIADSDEPEEKAVKPSGKLPVIWGNLKRRG